MLELVPESIVRVLIAVCFFLFVLAIACFTKPHREAEKPKPRNVRRAPPSVEIRANVRRPLAASCDCDAEVRNAEIRALIADAAPMSADDHERQRRSFAYGNAAISNPHVTREMVDRAAEAMPSTATVIVPAWTDASWDEPTLTSPRGEA